MIAMQSYKWISRHGKPFAALVIVILIGAAAHLAAVAKISILGDSPTADWPPRLLRNMIGIQFFNAHCWLTLPYLLLFFATLLRMELRGMPRWAVWTTFGFLSLPLVSYFIACFRIGTCCIHIAGPLSGP